MSNRTIKHEIKLQPSVIVLLGLLTIAVCAYVFAPVFAVRNAEASFVGGNEMIAADPTTRRMWHMKDGEVRACFWAGNTRDVSCTPWSEK